MSFHLQPSDLPVRWSQYHGTRNDWILFARKWGGRFYSSLLRSLFDSWWTSKLEGEGSLREDLPRYECLGEQKSPCSGKWAYTYPFCYNTVFSHAFDPTVHEIPHYTWVLYNDTAHYAVCRGIYGRKATADLMKWSYTTQQHCGVG